MHTILIKRVYDPVSDADGFRVLVDRLWPRGISKEKAAIDIWAKGVTPTSELRKEYHQDLIDYTVFAEKYREELQANPESPDFIQLIRQKLEKGPVTFLTGTRQMEANHANVLKEWVEIGNSVV